jgi:hypothetical protein
MPVPLATLAAIGLPPLIGGISGQQQIKAQKQINERNIQFQTETLMNQRHMALHDWDKVNAYNHPAQQMQRYKESGLNPQLIYGNANNTPAGMVRTTNMEAPKADARGIIEGIGTAGQAINNGVQNAIAMQTLNNQTNLTNAQIIRMKADTDRTTQQFQLTSATWDELIQKVVNQNELTKSQFELNNMRARGQEISNINAPTKQMVYERYLAESATKSAQAKHVYELYQLAKKEGKLKQADINMLESLSTGKLGFQTAENILKIILQSKLK